VRKRRVGGPSNEE